ncbi:heavy metal response regulator transcription factor [Geobacter pelophilus]|uniref:Heavy metal response regulator transcription factor n=1 Tax=Geoanaerobacter pelophilus TaxID=60036 RepID=A0AAW4KXD9_9BACT|nr:heavy metal response regulator transcription factor [Geoanaerobacter pelophilus]MBT0663288.1 heavy metal response regulator transcription factor [Geoanaerobacter pelophilus]
MRVLVVEDEFKTADFIKKGLLENGFRVDVAHYGTDALKLATSSDYDIIILDVMLPGMDGREVLKSLREKSNLTPVIFLTALDGLEDRLQGLKLGADDYIVKPFAFAELLARIHTVLRRGQPRSVEIRYAVDDLELDLAAHRVTRQGTRIDLTPKEFTLLSLLLKNKGEALSRTRIAERIWNLDDFHETNVVDVHMRRLRAKVDDPFEKKLIHTVRGVGYVLEDRG